MIILPILITSPIHFSLGRLGECSWEWKGWARAQVQKFPPPWEESFTLFSSLSASEAVTRNMFPSSHLNNTHQDFNATTGRSYRSYIDKTIFSMWVKRAKEDTDVTMANTLPIRRPQPLVGDTHVGLTSSELQRSLQQVWKRQPIASSSCWAWRQSFSESVVVFEQTLMNSWAGTPSTRLMRWTELQAKPSAPPSAPQATLWEFLSQSFQENSE